MAPTRHNDSSLSPLPSSLAQVPPSLTLTTEDSRASSQHPHFQGPLWTQRKQVKEEEIWIKLMVLQHYTSGTILNNIESFYINIHKQEIIVVVSNKC